MRKRSKQLLSVCLSSVMAAASLSSSLFVVANEPVTEKEASSERDPLVLWYNKSVSQMKTGLGGGGSNYPTQDDNAWQQLSLPIGNGDMGANVFGDVETERLTFNEKTLWTGGPSESRPDYMGGNLENKGKNGETIQEIQSLFLSGNSSAASSKCNELVGTSTGYGAYQSWGNVYLDFQGLSTSGVSNYTRDLNLNNALAGVHFDQGDVHYEREYFISHPDNVLAMKLSASKAGSLNFDIRFESNQGATPAAEGDTILLHGEVSDNQLQYSSVLRADHEGGTLSADGSKLSVRGADSVTIFVSAATDYKNDYPVYRTGETLDDVDTRVRADVDAAITKGYAAIREDHIADYDSLFGRMSLNLGNTVSDKPTNELLNAYKNGTASDGEKRQLESMLFQYGRYLTISSSREDSQLPANLQGVWSVNNTPPWASDYHMNVNLQMNYWPTYSTNLAECALPLVTYVNSLREPGRVTAKIYASVESTEENPENGFMAHTQNTPFGWTCPGWSFDWGWSPAAVPWILQNVWEYYDFTRDEDFLRNTIYPMMKEEATLYDQILVRDADGKLVSAPSYSPEHGPRTAGNTYEHSLIWQLYEDTIKAAEILGVDEDKVAVWKQNQADLKGPIEIGDSGQIKEWYEETTLGSVSSEGYNHRHLSHMLGLFPGDLITVDTPEYFEAARVSMNNRTDSSTGWGMGQRINTWARLRDGDKALELIGDLFNSGIYANLWDTHSPFQIDGNFGMTSGVAEMLLQSHAGFIDLLPALPAEWADGSVEDMKARGDFTLDMTWSDCSMEEVRLTSEGGEEAVLNLPGIALADVVDAGNGEAIETVLISQDRISFDTEAGHTYIISGIPAKETAEAAPTGLHAYRESSDSVSLNWDAAEDCTWTVYKKQEDGSILKLAEDLQEASFTDAAAYEAMGDVQYAISAVNADGESLKTEWLAPTDLRTIVGMVDDRDPAITWTGAWGDWSESVNYAGTIKYLEKLTGHDTAELTFVGTGIELISCTNHDRGMLEISIDGEVIETVDTYSSSTGRQAKVFSKTDLPYGRHTIVVRATNTKNPSSSREKVEVDAFNVLNTELTAAESLNITSANGLTTVGKADSTLQMKAEIAPAGAFASGIDWSVTNASGSETDLASIDENGLLRVGEESGTVVVHASLKNNSAISASAQIQIALPEAAGTPVTEETIVEDAIQEGGSWKLNPVITWNGSWSTWAGEPEKHHGTTKTEANAPASLNYTYTGSTIEIYVQKHTNFSSFDITLDGENKGNFSMYGSSSGDPQSLLASFETEEGEHTLEMTVVSRGIRTMANLDYIKVVSVSTADGLDRTALQNAIEAQKDIYEAAYTADSWTAFQSALDHAVEVMNAEDSTQADIDGAALALLNAADALVSVELDAPVVADCGFRAAASRRDAVLLSWNAADHAVKYEILDAETGDVLAETTELNWLLKDLESGSEYRLILQAVGADGKTAQTPALSVKTLADEDVEAPAVPSGFEQTILSDGSVKLTWKASEDVSGVKCYRIYENGKLVATVTEPEWTAAVEGAPRTVKIVAVDTAGNVSLPASVTLKKEALSIAEVIAPAGLTATAPVSFADLQLPAAVEVKLSDGSNAFVNVVWSAEGFDGTKAGEVQITGTLQNSADITNPLDLRAVITVTLIEKTEVQKTLLQEAVDYAEELKTTVDPSIINVLVWNHFNEALDAAKAVLADENATQEEVNQAWTDLTYAIQMIDFTADKTALNALIAECQQIDLKLYKDGETKDAFVAALAHAVEISESETALDASIQEAAAVLQSAREALEPKSEIDTRMLAWLVAETEGIDRTAYADTTAFEEALASAKAVLADPADQESVDAALNSLSSAYLALRLKPSEEMLKELQGFVETVSLLDLNLYTDEARVLLLETRDLCLNALNNKNLTKDEAQKVIDQINTVKPVIDSGLKPADPIEPAQKPESPAEPAQKPETPAEPAQKPAAEEQKPAESVKPVKNSVSTAFATGTAGLAAAGLGAAAILAALRRRNRK